MCIIYNNEAERRRIISGFLKAGILGKEKLAYFAHTTDKSEITGWFQKYGVDLENEQVEVLDALQTYCPNSRFNPEQMLDTLRSFYNNSVDEGFPGSRVSGEMTWALENIPGSDRLMEYEALVNRVVETHPVTAICQYDATKFDGATILECLKVHPYMIVCEQIVRNPYYLSPEEYLLHKS
jgi:hypothetical protein